MTTATVRNIALAAVTGTALAVVVDVMMQMALGAGRIAGGAVHVWAADRIIGRSTWVAAAAILWVIAPVVSVWYAAPQHTTRPFTSRSMSFAVIGQAMLGLPLLWIVATWIVWAVNITLLGSWEIDGGMFVSGSYYTNVLVWYIPWACAGAVTLTLSRHVTDAPVA